MFEFIHETFIDIYCVKTLLASLRGNLKKILDFLLQNVLTLVYFYNHKTKEPSNSIWLIHSFIYSSIY